MATYNGNAFANTYVGTAQADDITMNAGDDIAYGQGGDDEIDGGWGDDSLHGGAGSDFVSGGHGEDFVFGDAGADNVSGGQDDDTVRGGDDNDFLTGGDGNDRLFGDAGDDTLEGDAGADIIDGGAGADTVSYVDSAAAVSVNLATGLGSGGDAQGDTFVNVENITGTDFADTLTGNAGANFLNGGDGADVLDGGAGLDVVFYASSDAGVTVNLSTGLGSGGDAAGDVLINIEHVFATNFDDNITGNAVANTIVAFGGNDSVNGAGGDDFLRGEEGDDTLFGGDGNDTLRGGNDADTLEGEAGDDTLDGDAGVDTVAMSHWSGLFDLFSTSYSITLGEAGADGAAVRTVNMVLPIEAERDILRDIENVEGSAKNETIIGNSGANVLSGNGGKDVVAGGGGADAFVWRNVNESSTAIAAMDLIVDFDPLEGDRIDLSAIDANLFAAGNQAFTFIGAAAFSGTPGEINFVHLNGETIIQLQTGLEGDVEMGIRIAGIVTPDASWFVL